MMENAIRVASESASARVPGADRASGPASIRRSRIAACARGSRRGCTASGPRARRDASTRRAGRGAGHAGAPARDARPVRGRVPAGQRRCGARAAGGRAGRVGRGAGARRAHRRRRRQPPRRRWTRRIATEAPLIPVPELGRVERTILRSALFEVLYSAATPSGETMRDAVIPRPDLRRRRCATPRQWRVRKRFQITGWRSLTLTDGTTYDRLKKIIVEQLGVDEEEVTAHRPRSSRTSMPTRSTWWSSS